MDKYLVLMLPRFVPLGLELRTLAEANRAVDWQVRGGNLPENYLIAEVVNGSVLDTEGNPITLFNGIYTTEGWDNFLQMLKEVK